uniref:glutathione transferase n=1 Tax=Daphnia pulex TaxID=6669 RepID=A0A7G9KW90_DAPPU|nr:glutathione S-transferase sigma 2 [Daphnia pulex]
MVHYKLIYFNLRGRGELARLILHHQEVAFEDFRFEREEWTKYKTGTPFGQVPVLEVDGKPLAQSNAIARYLARQHGLAGQNEWEQSQADMYVDCIYDLISGTRPIIHESDKEKQKEILQKFLKETVNPHLEKLEQQLIKNGTGFLVGKSITWADLAYYSFFSPMTERFGDSVMDNSPHLKKLVEHVANIPQIKKYVETRPKTTL